MDQPPTPPYASQYPPPPPAKSGVPTWVWILLAVGCGGGLLVVMILAAILFPVFARARDAARATACASNEKQMALAVMMYAQDCDETLPRSDGWMDRLGAYTRDETLYHCPAVSDKASYGYAYNSNESGVKLEKIRQPNTAVLLYDSQTLSRNAADAEASLPTPPRHFRGNNVAYVDGHVQNTGHSSQD